MNALSIKEPWVEQILRLFKPSEPDCPDFHVDEYRSWYKGYRGPVLLVSSLRLDDCAFERYEELGDREWAAGDKMQARRSSDAARIWPHPLGHARGLAVVRSAQEVTRKDWKGWAWRLGEIHRLEHPFPVKGRLGIYTVDLASVATPEALDEIEEWMRGLPVRAA